MNRRRRTSCVYCGERISGKLDDGYVPVMGQARPLLVYAARFACWRHRSLVAYDPELQP